MKQLSLKHVVKKAKMNEADAKLLGKLFVSCAKAAGGGHETLQGASINEATLLSMTAEDTPQTIHADDVVQSLAIIYNASNVAVMGPEFLNLKPVILTGVGIQPTTAQGQSVYALLSLPKPCRPHGPGLHRRARQPCIPKAPLCCQVGQLLPLPVGAICPPLCGASFAASGGWAFGNLRQARETVGASMRSGRRQGWGVG